MARLTKSSIFLALLYFAPWINVFSYRISSAVAMSFVFLCVILITMFSILERTNVRVEYFKIIARLGVMYATMLCTLLLYLVEGFFNPIFIFFNLFLILTLIFPLVIDIEEFAKRYLYRYLSYLIILISISIIVDYILLHSGMMSMQIMYDPEKFTYIDRPFGLFGQPSVNASLICTFYLLRLYIGEIWSIDKSKNKGLLILATIAVILQGSGSGFISLLFVYIAINRINKYLIIVIFPILIGVIHYIVVNDIVDKVGVTYITELFDFFLIVLDEFFSLFSSARDILIGVFYPKFQITIDFGPLYHIVNMGAIMYVAFYSMLLSLYIKEKNRNFRYSLIILTISSLHYPVMFYVVMHFVWVLLLFVVYRNRNN